MDEEYETDKYGNCIIPIDLPDDVLLTLFKGYIYDNGYSLASHQHCEILNEKNKSIEEIISSTVINELVYNIFKNEIEQRKKELNISDEKLKELYKKQEVNHELPDS